MKSRVLCILYILFCSLAFSPSTSAHEKCQSFLLNLNSSNSPHVVELKAIAKTLSELRYPGPVIARLSLAVDQDFFAIQRFLESEEVQGLVPQGFKGVHIRGDRGHFNFLAVGEAKPLFDFMTEILLRWPLVKAKGTIHLHSQEEAQFVFSRVLGIGETPLKYPFVGRIELEPNFTRRSDIVEPSKKTKRFHNTRVKTIWTKAALQKLKYLGVEDLEIEALIQESTVPSLRIGSEIILPLFRKIRSKDLFWDEVVSIKIADDFLPGRTQAVKILEISAMSVNEERAIYRALAERQGIKPEYIETKMLERLNFKGWKASRVYIHPAITAKLQSKHGVELNFLTQALKSKPSFVINSQVSNDRFELHYQNGENELVVVLGLNVKDNTTPLVTSYLKKSKK